MPLRIAAGQTAGRFKQRHPCFVVQSYAPSICRKTIRRLRGRIPAAGARSVKFRGVWAAIDRAANPSASFQRQKSEIFCWSCGRIKGSFRAARRKHPVAYLRGARSSSSKVRQLNECSGIRGFLRIQNIAKLASRVCRGGSECSTGEAH